jgi:hypothetical protein
LLGLIGTAVQPWTRAIRPRFVLAGPARDHIRVSVVGVERFKLGAMLARLPCDTLVAVVDAGRILHGRGASVAPRRVVADGGLVAVHHGYILSCGPAAVVGWLLGLIGTAVQPWTRAIRPRFVLVGVERVRGLVILHVLDALALGGLVIVLEDENLGSVAVALGLILHRSDVVGHQGFVGESVLLLERAIDHD